jgi:hypothetical protein
VPETHGSADSGLCARARAGGLSAAGNTRSEVDDGPSTKYNPDCSFKKLKARWNLRGDLIKRVDHRLGIEQETYTPTLKMSSLQRMTTTQAYKGRQEWLLKSFVVVSAFSSTDSTRKELLHVEMPNDIMPHLDGATEDVRDPAIDSDAGQTELYQVNASRHGLAEASHDFAAVLFTCIIGITTTICSSD